MPAQAPVTSKRIGDYQYERYDLSGTGSPPRKNTVTPPSPGAEKVLAKPGPIKRRPQTAQGSDTDSGIYHVRSHTLLQRRQPSMRNRLQRDTYFDKVLNNSEASSEEEMENESNYICEDCKMDSADYPYICRRCRMNPVVPHKSAPPPASRNLRQEPPQDYYDFYQRRRRPSPRERCCNHQWIEEDDVSDEELAPQPRSQPRAVEKRRPSAKGRGMKPQAQAKLEPADYSDCFDDWYRPATRPVKAQKPTPQRDIRREPQRNRRDQEYSDFDSNEDDNNSPPHKCYHRRSAQPESPQRRPKRYMEVVERKTTTRPSRQNDDEVRIRRKPIPDEYSADSWSEPSEQSYQTEDTYEHVESTRRPAQRPQRKDRLTKPKVQGPHQGGIVGRRMSTNDPKLRTMGARTANTRA